MKALAAILIAAPLLLTGCATNLVSSQKQANQISVTYRSDPPGAILIQADGKVFGEMPVTLNYAVSDAERAQGNKKLLGLTAQWSSGAMAVRSSINANLGLGPTQSLTFKRPENAPYLTMDTDHARKLQQQAEQRAAEQQRLAAQKAAEQRAAAQQESASSGVKDFFALLNTAAGIYNEGAPARAARQAEDERKLRESRTLTPVIINCSRSPVAGGSSTCMAF